MDNGIVTIAGSHSVDETVAKLLQVLEAKGVKVFAVIDHSGEALNIGITMPNTKLVVFGNPAAGTPLMLASPLAAIDLPLKILVAEDTEWKALVSYNSPDYLRARHGLPEELVKNTVVVEIFAKSIACP